MDIALNPVAGGVRVNPPAVSVVTTPPPQAKPTTPPVPQAAVTDSVTPQAQKPDGDDYQAALEQIASSFRNDYAVSDKQFSIFKDATGKYITRYVSLRDGSITYVPSAPKVVRPASILSADHIAISA